MEQGTGWHAAIITGAISRGQVQPGVIPVEKAMSGTDFVAEAACRNFKVELELHPVA